MVNTYPLSESSEHDKDRTELLSVDQLRDEGIQLPPDRTWEILEPQLDICPSENVYLLSRQSTSLQ